MKIKDAISNWLLFDLCLTVFLLMTIGVDGLAKLACEVVNHENCSRLK